MTTNPTAAVRLTTLDPSADYVTIINTYTVGIDGL
jgi:hypothetical protein